MTTVPGSSVTARPPLGRRTFAAIVLIGLSALAWGGVARDTTKDVMPESVLPWVLIQGGDHSHQPAVAPAPASVDAPHQ